MVRRCDVIVVIPASRDMVDGLESYAVLTQSKDLGKGFYEWAGRLDLRPGRMFANK